ncbi:MAG: nucleotidyl transferase AbiEii/AbiGii toxin family protein [Endomicrobium sp.]|nr:nucleotidyl transferase AbiEii/AbiGii toxin family protein [Endomicrobium sp.]
MYGSFYFSGGTALSEYYLRHRYSEDLDFFRKMK